MKKIICLIAALLIAMPAWALETSNTFTIKEIFVSQANNLHFRIYGMNNLQTCPNAANWAYIDEADSGEKGKISILEEAYALGKSVFVNVEGINYYGNGVIYCHIVEVVVSG